MTPDDRTLAPEERADLFDAWIESLRGFGDGFAPLLAHVTELAYAYRDAGLVEGDLAHDGTIRAEAAAVEHDHPGINHEPFIMGLHPCPKCGVCKFIGHGPLCIDCYQAASA